MKLLLIEDNPGDARLIREVLRDASDTIRSFTHSPTLSEGLSRLDEGDINIVLLDLSLPDGHGLDNVRAVHERFPELPLIVLTGLDDDSVALEAIRTGADDYLVKGRIDWPYLRRITRYAVERKKSETQLRAALEHAEAANRTKSTFLAHMSHELRTPLNAIIGFAQMLVHEIFGPLPHPRYKEYASDIHKSGLYLLELISDLLDLAKAESGKLDLAESDVHLKTVLADCLQMLAPQIEDNQLDLNIDFTGDVPDVWGDFRFIKQIILNILSNALKFTPNKGSILIRCCLNAQKCVVLSIHDSGIGMESDDIPKALSSFGQINNAGLNGQRGTGLGLPLSKRLAELHGGTLWLESVRDVGTTVYLQFPAWRSRVNHANGEAAQKDMDTQKKCLTA